ncbi:MFS transporter [Marivibrio halodurans]|uniref:MFS transporter n=1 Tax=Marivibrio halodurans TaxID=2039722 RepID=A0A8J7V2I6_9PROT|nr:MFS transporter [Marivibrio halodurans]MBP5857201.1 MFS transporter [Marivibrio halodurans]
MSESTRASSASTRLSPFGLLAYGLIGLPLAAATLPVYVLVPGYYAVELGLGLSAVGAVLFAMRLWDVVSDPLIGALSDRTRGRFGRRRPWIAAGAPVTALGAWMLFAPGDGAGLGHLAGAAFLLYLGWTMVMLPYGAWGAELSGDYDERSRIAAAREGFVVAGTLVAAAAAGWAGADRRADGLMAVGLLVVVLLPVTAALLLARVPDPPPARPTRIPWRDGLKVMGRNRPFRRLIAAWLLNGVANGLPATLFLLYVDHHLAAPDKSGWLLLTYFGVAIAGLPLWLGLSRRFGKHRVWCGAMIWTCLWFSAAPFLGPGDVWLFAVVCVATGVALGADLALPPSMQADAVDVDTVETGGTARTGLYFALWGMATKLSLALAVGLAFPGLEMLGFDAMAARGGTGNVARTDGTMALAWMYGFAPIVFKLGAIALVWRHPLDAARQSDLRRRIAGNVVERETGGAH